MDFFYRYRFVANIKKRKNYWYKRNGIKEPWVRTHKARGRNPKITRGEKGLGAETAVLQY